MSIKSIYSNLEKSLERTISDSKSRRVNDSMMESAMDSKIGSESSKRSYNFVKSTAGLENFSPNMVNQHYGVKELVRHKFGKQGRLMPTFGCHPDFEDMEEGELRKGYSVTLFMDIIGSTKLGVIFPPETVFKIKNDIIRCAIETVNSFDGHVHRIMGDAVMAFFRKESHIEQGRIADSAIDTINCATYLIEMFKDVVIPKLNEFGVDESLGIRIGIDYGSDDQVVWGKYGHMESQEVTATSFFVDVAAKLQQKAPKNSIMIGDSFVKLIGFDENQLSVKTKIKDGVITQIKYLSPNYKDANGDLVNYKQFVLKNENYYKLLPTSDNEDNLVIKATLKINEDAPSEDEYLPCSRVIKKGMGISFKGLFYSLDHYEHPVFKFRVVNTGEEALKEENNGNHEYDEIAKYSDNRYFAKHWEDTAYKGLHHMYVSFWDGGRLIHNEKCFSVFIGE
ncbi:nucleotide-binding domain-containing protein [Erwinia pyrifoliae]|uniref:Adenylate/guanylate cyclase domain-containing protein n=2 Tax=Erwinia pyrifoliae TaxID=79967 RepID=A0ABY5X763_ERWPY|nr:adenylate/guanylate cyclase domain-containing protein [Erwinia pyrifoliae]UWS33223.1 adenylate/guanylate cyclase domain-containing protein [Erwinia pyrifoliae]CAX56970.1 putative Adenylate/Guanylate Cyclase [Erwinia pyrifoliae Ep1/96]